MKSIDGNYGAKIERLFVDSTRDRIFKSTPVRMSFEHFEMWGGKGEGEEEGEGDTYLS